MTRYVTNAHYSEWNSGNKPLVHRHSHCQYSSRIRLCRSPILGTFWQHWDMRQIHPWRPPNTVSEHYHPGVDRVSPGPYGWYLNRLPIGDGPISCSIFSRMTKQCKTHCSGGALGNIRNLFNFPTFMPFGEGNIRKHDETMPAKGLGTSATAPAWHYPAALPRWVWLTILRHFALTVPRSAAPWEGPQPQAPTAGPNCPAKRVVSWGMVDPYA